MRKSVNAVLLSRAYSHAAWQAILNLRHRVDEGHHPLLTKRSDMKNICVVIITSNRGLCGGFNSHILLKTLKFFDKNIKNPNLKIEWIAVGKKGAEFLAKSGKNIIASFPKPETIAGTQDVSGISKIIIDGYISTQYDEIYVVYTDFVSAMLQKPRIIKLLPFEPVEDSELGSASKDTIKEEAFGEEYLFEPSPDAVIDLFLRKLINIQLYQALLESTASEHSSRMMAMRQATDAAGDMIDELTLIFNQARQAAITKEIAEIAGGKAVLENS